MAGQFLTGSTTFMSRHTAGRNSTGMYIISGIPQMKSSAANFTMPLDSLSREITVSVTGGTWDVWFDSDGKVGGQVFTIIGPAVVSFPIRVGHVQVEKTGGNGTCAVLATLTGLDKTGYPATKGDGKLTTS